MEKNTDLDHDSGESKMTKTQVDESKMTMTQLIESEMMMTQKQVLE